MATGKGVGGPKGKGGMDWGDSVRPSMVQRPPNSYTTDSSLQKYLSAAMVVLCIVLVILIPVTAMMWGDLNYALVRAEYQTGKMEALYRKLLEERKNERATKQTGLDDHQVAPDDGNNVHAD